MSGSAWCAVAREHPEFFRCFQRATEDSAALIARYLTGDGADGPILKPEHIHGLVEAAIRIHQGQLQRRQVLRFAWAAGFIAAIPGVFGVVAVLLNKFL